MSNLSFKGFFPPPCNTLQAEHKWCSENSPAPFRFNILTNSACVVVFNHYLSLFAHFCLLGKPLTFTTSMAVLCYRSLWFVPLLTGANHVKTDVQAISDHAMAAHTVTPFHGSFSWEKKHRSLPQGVSHIFFSLFECGPGECDELPVVIGLWRSNSKVSSDS